MGPDKDFKFKLEHIRVSEINFQVQQIWTCNFVRKIAQNLALPFLRINEHENLRHESQMGLRYICKDNYPSCLYKQYLVPHSSSLMLNWRTTANIFQKTKNPFIMTKWPPK